VLPTEVDTTTNFARQLPVNIPLAFRGHGHGHRNHRLAIAICGGRAASEWYNPAICHRPAMGEGKSDRVKRSKSAMIVDPVTISPDITLRQALEIMNKYKISGLPVTRGLRLTGILTNADLCDSKKITRNWSVR